MDKIIYNLCDDDTNYNGFTNGETMNGSPIIWVNENGLNELINNPDIIYYPSIDEYENLGKNEIMMNANNIELFDIFYDNRFNLYRLCGWMNTIQN